METSLNLLWTFVAVSDISMDVEQLFGLSKKFPDISNNLENIRYIAPEKLFLGHDKNDGSKKKKSSCNSSCEICR